MAAAAEAAAAAAAAEVSAASLAGEVAVVGAVLTLHHNTAGRLPHSQDDSQTGAKLKNAGQTALKLFATKTPNARRDTRITIQRKAKHQNLLDTPVLQSKRARGGRAGEGSRGRVASAASTAALQAASAEAEATYTSAPAAAARTKQPAWQPGSSRRKQTFSRCHWLTRKSARSGCSVSSSSAEERGRGRYLCLLTCPFLLVVQLVLVVPVELHVVDDRRHVFERLEDVHLYRRSAQGGTRQPTRSAGDGRLAGPARRRRAAPACEGWGRKNSNFRPARLKDVG